MSNGNEIDLETSIEKLRSVKLEPGVTFALEPMVSAGRPETRTLGDHWTVIMADGSLCAHFEHSLAITPDGPPLILTAL